MALVVPTAAMFKIPESGLFEDRGSSYSDQGDDDNKATLSNVSKPSVYTSKNVCDEEEFIKFGSSTTINAYDDDCNLVTVGGLSVKGFIPPDAGASEIEDLWVHLKAFIVDALP